MRSFLSECRDAMQIVFLLAGTLLVLCACCYYGCAIRLKLIALRQALAPPEQRLARRLRWERQEAERQMRQADRQMSKAVQDYFDELSD